MSPIYIKECFISHCSSDVEIMRRFSVIVDKYFSGLALFNTFDEKHTTKAGDDRSNAIKKHLKHSNTMIAMITDSYLRSTICISEISAFWFSSKRVIPIVFNGKVGSEFLLELFGKDIIYIDANLDPGKCAKRFLASMSQAGHQIGAGNVKDALQELTAFFKECHQARSNRRYIGMREDFDRILSYCNDYGIHQFRNTIMSTGEIIQKLTDKEQITILSTTGSNLINALSSEFLPKAIAAGTDVVLLLPNRDSQFVMDVAEIEMPEAPAFNISRLGNEFNNVMINLCSVVKKAHSIGGDKVGHVYVGCAFTLLRQTIVLGRKDDMVWGWTSLTIPPKKTNDGTPSLEFSGSVKTSSMAKLMYEHLEAITAISKKRPSAWIEILPTTNVSRFSFGIERASAKAEWQRMYDIAKRKTREHWDSGSDILIEVAAQHPLQKNGAPGKEFQMRLDQAIRAYHEMTAQGNTVRIYVPGSRHCFHGVADPVSLSASGVAYLRSKGIPEEHLLGEKENDRYKGDDGVYNSADECFVAANIFVDGHYKQLYCICSPNQMLRKQLFYYAFGVIPMMMTAPCNELSHDPIYELFEAIPQVIMYDHTWQGADSQQAQRTRKERDPRLQ